MSTFPLSDDFNRANESPIAGNWSSLTSPQDLKLTSNTIAPVTTDNSCIGWWNTDTLTADHYAECTFPTGIESTDAGPGIRSNTSGSIMVYIPQSLAVGYFVSGGYQGAIFNPTAASETGSTAVARVKCIGNTITAYVNGVSHGSATSALLAGNTRCGLFVQLTSLDNWGADSIPTSGVSAATRKPYNYNTKQLRNLDFRKPPFRYFAVPGTNAAAAPTHTTSGVLTGPGSTIVGSAEHKVKHPTSGVLTGQASSVVGSAAHKAKHTTTGVLAGLVSTIAGVARRFRSHPTTGVLTGQGSTIAGSAAHKAKHTTTGVLTGQGSSIVGSSEHNPSVSHVTTGILTGQLGSIVGAARRFRSHVTSGVLTGQASSIVGSSAHKAKHTTTGALAGLVASIAGVARRFRSHATTGVLTGQGSTIVGSAARNPSGVTHATSGVLTGQIGSIVGAARRFRAYVTSGALVGQISSIVGTAAHKAKHTTTGVLTGQASSIAGTSVHKAKHTTTGALTGQSSAIAGVSANGTAVTPVVNAGGGGGGRGIYYQDQKRRNIGKSKLNKLLDKSIAEYGKQLKGFAKSERPEVKKIVKPFIVDDAIVDYPSLQADIDAIRALMIEYQKFLVQQDEEEILILLLLEVI